MEFEIIEVDEIEYINLTPYYIQNRRAKNFIAEITGPHPKWRFERRFIPIKRVGDKHLAPLKPFWVGGYYDICFKSNEKTPANGDMRGFFKCVEIGDDHIEFWEVEVKEVEEKTGYNVDFAVKKIFEIVKKVPENQRLELLEKLNEKMYGDDGK